MEILNSSDITEDSQKWDLNLHVLVFKLKPQLYQKLHSSTGRTAT